MIYRARGIQLGYGRPIGILALEEHIPCPPGVPGNPTTFDFPVCYEIVRGASAGELANDPDPDPAPFIAAGRALVERGAAAIIGGCGLMIVHQDALARALAVPVMTSSLLQLPLLLSLIAPPARIGVIASSAANLKPRHLTLAGVTDPARIVLGGMDGRPAFRAAICDESGELDFAAVEAELVAAASELVTRDPAIGALLLECVDLPPYAAAAQAATGRPVFDVTTLARFAHSGLVRSGFAGVY